MSFESAIAKLDADKVFFDFVFMDPPYNKSLEKEVLRLLKNSSLIDSTSQLIIEASLETDFSYAEEMGYIITKEKTYKTNKHIFLKKVVNNMTRAIYPGSFDPVTLGHLDIIKRAAKIVDELIVGVLNNNSKTPLFSVENRVKMLEEVVKDIPNVKVMAFEGLLVDFAKSIDAQIIVRGLRAVTDFEYELQMSQTNMVLDNAIDTIFFTTSLEYAYLSSSTVKEAAFYGADISRFVPETVINAVYDKFKK